MTGFEPPEAARVVLSDVTREVAHALGDQLVGLYVVGSLVAGDFDERISDLDMIAAVTVFPDAVTMRAVGAAHEHVLALHPQWHDRLEILYITTIDLATWRGRVFPMARISPGEPFHYREGDDRWIYDWYTLREIGVALTGPPPVDLLGPIPLEDVVSQLVLDAASWPSDVVGDQHPGSLAYRVLTACRTMCLAERGTLTSKRAAAAWAQAQLPRWAVLIGDSLAVRDAGGHTGHLDPDLVGAFLGDALQRLQAAARG